MLNKEKYNVNRERWLKGVSMLFFLCCFKEAKWNATLQICLYLELLFFGLKYIFFQISHFDGFLVAIFLSFYFCEHIFISSSSFKHIFPRHRISKCWFYSFTVLMISLHGFWLQCCGWELLSHRQSSYLNFSAWFKICLCF